MAARAGQAPGYARVTGSFAGTCEDTKDLFASLSGPYNRAAVTLTPGTRFGAYDITAKIGEGGMGEVYRATDTRLKRQVAVQILPPSLAGDADRRARFQREAEVLASLNHPNIAAIHGLEEGA
jgi:serine/threonine protein kinase